MNHTETPQAEAVAFATWNPAKHVREAYEAAHQAAPVIERKPAKNRPAPARPAPVDDHQLALNTEAAQLPCPSAPRFTHWLPVTLTACIRCGREAATIINEANQLEAAS